MTCSGGRVTREGEAAADVQGGLRRDTASKAPATWPAMRTAARENQAFLGRAVRYLAQEADTLLAL